MSYPATVPNSRNFFLLAAVCAFLYLAAQIFQAIVLKFWDPITFAVDDAILARLLPLNQIRSVVVLLGFPAVLIAYAGVAMSAFLRSAGAATLGLIFISMFVALELSYRSVDLFLVTQDWAAQYRDTVDPTVRAALGERVGAWEGAVRALYFPLLLGHALGSAFLARAVWDANGWNRLMAGLLALNAMRATTRVLELHAGLESLSGFNAAIYMPATLLLFGFMGIWLLRSGLAGRAGA